jgi:hypothetical protein
MNVRTGIVLAAVAAAAIPATASAGTPTRTFKVEVEGVQKTTWKEHYVATQQCDQSADGSGFERVTFASPKPEKVVARRYGANFVFFDDGKLGSDELLTRAKITRKGKVVSSPLDPRCEGTGGSGQPTPKPDCGTRHRPFDLTIGWSPAGKSRGITIDTGLIRPLGYTYKNCPVIGPSFPDLIAFNTNGSDIRAAIPAADLFNRKLRKHIVIGRGKRVSKSASSSWTTTIRWTVSLTAVKK